MVSWADRTTPWNSWDPEDWAQSYSSKNLQNAQTSSGGCTSERPTRAFPFPYSFDRGKLWTSIEVAQACWVSCSYQGFELFASIEFEDHAISAFCSLLWIITRISCPALLLISVTSFMDFDAFVHLEDLVEHFTSTLSLSFTGFVCFYVPFLN